MITETLPLFVTVFLTIGLAYLLAAHWQLAQRFGVVMMVIIFGLILGNTGIVTQNGAVYDPLIGHLIPISIALLLFRLDFRELKKIKGTMVQYYLIGTVGTMIGTVVAFLLFADKIGPDAYRLAGQLGASYIGGGENAVAVAKAVGLLENNMNLFSAAFAADNVVTAIWMMVALSAPFGFSRYFSNDMPVPEMEAANEYTKPFSAAELLPSCCYSLGLAGLVVILGNALSIPVRSFAQAMDWQWLNFNTSILWVTTLALIVAQTRLREYLKVAYSLGMLFFLVFFFYMGAISSISEIVAQGPTIFVFTLTIVAIHGVFTLGIGWLRKADLATVFTASQCNIGGPSTAVALAEANGWHHMIVPSILVGVLGYAIANYCGIMLAQVILPLLGG